MSKCDTVAKTIAAEQLTLIAVEVIMALVDTLELVELWQLTIVGDSGSGDGILTRQTT